MRICRRIAAIRWQVKQLAALAEARAAEADRRAAPSFRPLTDEETDTILETDTIVGSALLEKLTRALS